jgi:hypothetical protein
MESVPLQMVLKFQVVLGLEVRTTVNVLLDMHVRTIVVGVSECSRIYLYRKRDTLTQYIQVAAVVQETATVDHGLSVVIVYQIVILGHTT